MKIADKLDPAFGTLQKVVPLAYQLMSEYEGMIYKSSTRVNDITYYRPSVNEFLRERTGMTLEDFIVEERIRKCAMNNKKIQAIKMEAFRRPVRRRIVEAARALWEGVDPCRVAITNDRGEVVDYQNRATMPDEKVWRAFRTRFAPTQSLERVLFPQSKLVETPSELPYSAPCAFLKDPTMRLKKTQLRGVSAEWIASTALDMLLTLTAYKSPEYRSNGCGGSVTTWINAAKDWHRRRLEAELAAGDVMQMSFITAQMRQDDHRMYRGIGKLRVKLGLHELPRHRNYAVSQDEMTLNKFFAKIINQACVHCPISSYLFRPIGIEGLLEHMRINHPSYFWAGEFHSLA